MTFAELVGRHAQAAWGAVGTAPGWMARQHRQRHMDRPVRTGFLVGVAIASPWWFLLAAVLLWTLRFVAVLVVVELVVAYALVVSAVWVVATIAVMLEARVHPST